MSYLGQYKYFDKHMQDNVGNMAGGTARIYCPKVGQMFLLLIILLDYFGIKMIWQTKNILQIKPKKFWCFRIFMQNIYFKFGIF